MRVLQRNQSDGRVHDLRLKQSHNLLKQKQVNQHHHPQHHEPTSNHSLHISLPEN